MSELNMRRLEMDLIGGHRNPVYETVADILKDRERLQRIEQCAREVVQKLDQAGLTMREEEAVEALRKALDK